MAGNVTGQQGQVMRVTWWGTRGGIATPEPDVMRYGGDTSCVEVRTSEGHLLVFDAGTGLRQLGQKLLRDPTWNRETHIFFSHFHWDHIQGIPFFAPIFLPGHELFFYGSFKADKGIMDILQGQMGGVYFPVGIEEVRSSIQAREMLEETIQVGSTRITSRHLNHPQGCFGYRVEDGGGVFVYATDVEQDEGLSTDPRIIALAKDADVLAFDAQYTPQEYLEHIGWGHSTWRVAARVAREAGVGRLVLIHHDPYHPDDVLDRILAIARQDFPDTLAAYRGLTINIPTDRPRAKVPAELAPPTPHRKESIIEVREDGVVVTLPDVVNVKNYQGVDEAVRHALQTSGRQLIVLDFREVGRLDSTALGAMVNLKKHLDGAGATLRAAKVSRAIHELFVMTGLDRLVPIYDTVAQALTAR